VRAGYGDISPGECWLANWAVVVQSIFALLLNAVLLGIVFARISHPKQRGRTILISDSAVVSRRDGVLKFMFRVADIRSNCFQVRRVARGSAGSAACRRSMSVCGCQVKERLCRTHGFGVRLSRPGRNSVLHSVGTFFFQCLSKHTRCMCHVS
jgi:Inward rectifier potassium channel transmembrane domain